MNFGTILNSVTKTCVTMMVESKDNESRQMARGFIDYIQIKDPLNKQFRVYHQLNSSFIKDKDSARTFVNETFKILDDFNFKDILAYNALVETRFNVKKLKPTDLNSDIATVIKYVTSKEKINQIDYVTAIDNIVEHVSTFRPEEDMLSELNEKMSNSSLKFLQPKHVVRIALKRFNEKYSDKFDVDDRKVFHTLREGNEKTIMGLYDDLFDMLISEVSAFDGNGELKEKVLKAQERISSGCTQDNILNAYELFSELKKIREEK